MTITEGNKLIMAYDGWRPIERISLSGKPNYIVWLKFVKGEPVFEILDEDIEHDIVYHKSWDALMPAYKKAVKFLEKLGEVVKYDNPLHETIFGLNGIYSNLHSIVNGEIEPVWNALVNYIVWFNELSSASYHDTPH